MPCATCLDQNTCIRQTHTSSTTFAGAWCEGLAYHYAVSDADMKKDTNNNLELIARLMNGMYQKYGALPLAISLIQDNTSRECTNQMMLKIHVKLVALNCVESFTYM